MNILIIAKKTIRRILNPLGILIIIIFPLYEVFIFSEIFNKIPSPLKNNEAQGIVRAVYINSLNPISCKQFYAAAMLTSLILTLGPAMLAYYLINERKHKILEREYSMPIKRSEIIFGYGIANVLIYLVSSIIIIAISSIFLNVSWGHNILGVIIVSIIMAFIVTIIGLISGAIFKTAKTAIVTVMCIMTGFSFLSDSYLGYMSSSPFFQTKKYFINYYIYDSYIKLMQERDISSIMSNIIILLAFILILCIITAVIYNRETNN